MVKHPKWKQIQLDLDARDWAFVEKSFNDPQNDWMYVPPSKEKKFKQQQFFQAEQREIILASGSQQDMEFRLNEFRKWKRKHPWAYKKGKKAPAALYSTSIPKKKPGFIRGSGFTRRPGALEQKASISSVESQNKTESRTGNRKIFTQRNVAITGTVVGTTMIAYTISEKIKQKKKKRMANYPYG